MLSSFFEESARDENEESDTEENQNNAKNSAENDVPKALLQICKLA